MQPRPASTSPPEVGVVGFARAADTETAPGAASAERARATRTPHGPSPVEPEPAHLGAARVPVPSVAAPPAETPPKEAPAAKRCPEDMVLVEGEYCTEVQHDCRHWLDDETLPYARCGVYERTTRCIGKHIAMTYCIDRHEYTAPGETLPLNHQSFYKANQLCKKAGKRLCTESEWNFACEGEEMLPYPYGYERAPKCNQDQPNLFENNPQRRVLKDLRAGPEDNPDCVSPFGVHDMVGNLDEPVRREGAHAHPFRNALKGGWWMSGRNRCRPATTAHDEYYTDIQIGVRCCANAQSDGEGAGRD